MIVTTKELFAHAYGKYAIGAYNINNMEQAMGLFRGNLDSQAATDVPTPLPDLTREQGQTPASAPHDPPTGA